MGTSDKLTIQMLETEPHFATIPRTISPILPSRSAMDRSLDYGSHSSDSGVRQDYIRTVNGEQMHASTGIKLPVKHITSLGTQRGTLLVRYLTHRHSKCITCQDCGIFFSQDAFLAHSHDRHGRKRHRHQADILELDVENPSSQELRSWEEFLSKTGQKARTTESSLASASLDLGIRKGDYNLEPSTGSQISAEKPTHRQTDEHVNKGHTLLSDFDKTVQDTVNASERLLKETSQYLHSSAEKLRHRRQRSLKNYQFHPASLPDDLPSNPVSSTEHVQPIIKDASTSSQNPKRPHRKFLEKYFEKSRDSFQLLTDSMASRSTSKPDSLGLEARTSTGGPQQESSMLGSGEIKRDVAEDGGKGGGDADRQAVDHISARPTSPGKTPLGKSIILQEHFDRNDPLFIVQTAQELLTLAAHKMQERQQKSPGGIDWQKRYEFEKERNREKDKRIRELEGLLEAEQRKRQDAEVQLRAIRLQNL
ncbi:uncharacterized protein LOC110987088 isoform X2 [Acanthaster planci]|uniref:Uncharacterized protein LOC110987088 isoform X2 n=1 Tax=Acanthaster planci TaxID=133434 RepID=A0A8B7ZHT4_ACAPL|nr:uncharacterized protein LOC110987088 isoform X2 [Acanthaster planci]